MSKYLIKLKPLGKYFFGGDMSFEVGDKSKDYNSKYSSYIIESNKFPQQTSLLGMLRYLLLTKSPKVFSLVKNQITNKSGAANVIGHTSFSVIPDHKLDEKQDSRFGKIVSIGPCFLLHEYRKDDRLVEEYFLSAPKDSQFIVSFVGSIDAYYNGNMLKVPSISYEDKKEQPDGVEKIEIVKYSSKAEFDTIYISGNGSTTKKEDEIFIKDTRIGINKSYEGKTSHDDKGYYKQVSYRLKDSFSFAFVAEVDFDLSGCQNEIVSLGADGSKFSLSASLISDKYQTPHYPDGITQVEGACRVILLSDSLLASEDIKKACFNISESVPFRFLETDVKCENYNVLGGTVKRSEKKYYLYEKGSVFYFENEASANKFVELVEGKEEFHQIGYNYCEKK
jgi:CRISPR-associated protein Cmr3